MDFANTPSIWKNTKEERILKGKVNFFSLIFISRFALYFSSRQSGDVPFDYAAKNWQMCFICFRFFASIWGGGFHQEILGRTHAAMENIKKKIRKITLYFLGSQPIQICADQCFNFSGIREDNVFGPVSICGIWHIMSFLKKCLP